MRFSKSVAAVFILADSLSLVLGAQTIQEITDNIAAAQIQIENANDYLDIKSPLGVATIIDNNNNISANVKLYDSALGGAPTLTVTDQTTLSNATGSLLGALGKYGASGQGLAGAFISVGTQLLALGTSFDNVNNAMAQYGKDLEALAPNFGPTITEQIASAEKTFAALDATLKAKGA